MKLRKSSPPLGRILIPFLITLFFIIPVAHSEETKVMIFAWEQWEPFQYKDANGQLTGVEVELMNAILGRMGILYKWQDTPWKRALKDLEEGFLDAALAAAITPEREKWAYFSDPYLTGGSALFVKKGTVQDYPFESLRDIIGTNFKLGVTRGYYYGELYEELAANAEFQKHIDVVNINENNHRKLVKGRIDGFLDDPISAVAGLKSLGIFDQVERHPMEVYSDSSRVIFSKKRVSLEFIAKFNQSLEEIRADGTYDKILDKWLK